MGLLALVAMWFAATGLGALILERGGAMPSLPSMWQQYVFSILTGWVVIGLAVLLFGLAGLANRPALGVLLAAAAAIGIRGWSALLAPMRNPDSPATRADVAMPGWLLAFAFLIYLLVIPYALTPSIQSDELRYHLAAPEAYLDAGRIHYLPHQAFSNFPFLVEMLFMLAMAVQGAEAAKAIHASFLETSAVAVALFAYLLIRLTLARRRRDVPAREIAGMAGVAFAAIPSVIILAGWAFVDIATAAYVIAAAYLGALLLARRQGPPAWLLGVMAAGAIGTKYLAVPIMLALAVLLLLMKTRQLVRQGFDSGPALRYLSRACIVAALLSSPWFVKNWIQTGNPVYPLAYGIFGGGEWSESNAEFYASKAAEKGFRLAQAYPGESIDDSFYEVSVRIPPALRRPFELLISPITSSLAAERFEDHFVGPLALMAMVLMGAGAVAWFLTRRPPGTRLRQNLIGVYRLPLLWTGLFLAILWVIWFFTYQSIRMLIPAFGLVFALGAWGAALLLRSLGRGDRQRAGAAALGAMVAIGLLYSWSYAGALIIGKFRPHPLRVAFGFQTREAYLQSALTYYEPAQMLAGRLKAGERALVIGEYRTLYLPGPVIVSDWFDTPQPLPLIRETPSNEELFEKLKELGVKYVFFNAFELRQYERLYFIPRFTPLEYARFQAFISNPKLKAVHRDPELDIYIYEIAYD